METNNDRIKITFVGESNVGKTSIIERYITNKFNSLTPTIGASFIGRDVVYKQKVVKLGIWDTAGQERYKALSRVYLRNTNICILVFDVTCYFSFKRMMMWMRICDESNPDREVIYYLVGNKTDLEERIVPTNELEEFCDNNKIVSYIETSARNGTGINDLYDMIIKSSAQVTNPITNNVPLVTDNDEIKNSTDTCSC